MSDNPKISVWNKIRLILMLSSLFVFVAVGIFSSIHDSNVCDPERLKIVKNLEYLAHQNSIKNIELAKSSPGWQVNLVDKTIIITDSNVIEKIRAMINNRQQGEFNHPIDKWETQMIINLTNNQSLNVTIHRISNDTMKQMTHIFFASKSCEETQPQYSLELGVYLELLTGYKGYDYK